VGGPAQQGIRVAASAARTIAMLALVLMASTLRAEALDELEQARHDLAISEQVLATMIERVRLARADPGVEAAERQRLDQYLARVEKLVALNRERLAALSRPAAGQPGGAASNAPRAAQAPRLATEAEEIAELEKKLSASLGEFDELLLEEARRARTRNADARSNRGGSGGSGTGPAVAGGTGGGTEGAGAAATAAGATASGNAEADSPRSAGEPGSPGARITGTEAGAAGGTTAAVPPDVGDGSDDDVVARQIRKAAENEADPDLRKKLWEEYRKYKEGTKG
jgi:hypothetical protein